MIHVGDRVKLTQAEGPIPKGTVGTVRQVYTNGNAMLLMTASFNSSRVRNCTSIRVGTRRLRTA